MQFSSRFKELCKQRRVTQKQALEDMGLHRNAAQRWSESNPRNETLVKIAEYFEMSTDEVLGLAQKEKPADQKADGLRGTGYEELTPENRKMIDTLIETLLKSQSGE